jgi:hypothetical protein
MYVVWYSEDVHFGGDNIGKFDDVLAITAGPQRVTERGRRLVLSACRCELLDWASERLHLRKVRVAINEVATAIVPSIPSFFPSIGGQLGQGVSCNVAFFVLIVFLVPIILPCRSPSTPAERPTLSLTRQYIP